MNYININYNEYKLYIYAFVCLFIYMSGTYSRIMSKIQIKIEGVL